MKEVCLPGDLLLYSARFAPTASPRALRASLLLRNESSNNGRNAAAQTVCPASPGINFCPWAHRQSQINVVKRPMRTERSSVPSCRGWETALFPPITGLGRRRGRGVGSGSASWPRRVCALQSIDVNETGWHEKRLSIMCEGSNMWASCAETCKHDDAWGPKHLAYMNRLSVITQTCTVSVFYLQWNKKSIRTLLFSVKENTYCLHGSLRMICPNFCLAVKIKALLCEKIGGERSHSPGESAPCMGKYISRWVDESSSPAEEEQALNYRPPLIHHPAPQHRRYIQQRKRKRRNI